MIAGILLAAGRAERFGAAKLVARIGGMRGTPVIRSAAEGLLASELDEVVVVLGSEAPAVRRALEGLGVRLVVNDRYAEGMSSSIRAGVEHVRTSLAGAAGVLVALGDQPTVGASIVNALLARFQALALGARSGRARTAIVASRYMGVVGPPVLFARALFPELLALAGDRGAREVVTRDPSRVAFVEFASACPPDIDTAHDLRALGRWGDGQRAGGKE